MVKGISAKDYALHFIKLIYSSLLVLYDFFLRIFSDLRLICIKNKSTHLLRDIGFTVK